MSVKTLGFIGLGLIGGSIVKTVKRIYPDIRIIARSGRQTTITQAFEERLIENKENALITDFADCDVIFLCTPVQQNLSYLCQLKTVIKPSCILTDVGSVKGDIHRAVTMQGLDSYFIGGHPMAGSEKTGLSYATAYLLENAYYILTPTPLVDKCKVLEFTEFIRSLGAIPLIFESGAHDTATAAISHLPHVIDSALVNFVRQSDDGAQNMKTIAAGGFKDITRIAASSPVMWEEICLSNREKLLFALDDYQNCLSQIRADIAASNAAGIRSFFQSAKNYRDSLAVSPAHGARTVFELYCDLMDKTGEIATVAAILAKECINIKNIGIIHNREFEEGVLKIELYDQKAYDSAITLLQKYSYTVYER